MLGASFFSYAFFTPLSSFPCPSFLIFLHLPLLCPLFFVVLTSLSNPWFPLLDGHSSITFMAPHYCTTSPHCHLDEAFWLSKCCCPPLFVHHLSSSFPLSCTLLSWVTSKTGLITDEWLIGELSLNQKSYAFMVEIGQTLIHSNPSPILIAKKREIPNYV